MSDLPKVYINPINKDFENFQHISNSSDRKVYEKKNLSMKIKDIFSSNNYVYKRKVRITTKNETKEKVVVGKNNGYLIMLDGEKIKLTDIYDIDII
ncbi:MAG: hypothetical protein R3Y13_01450 [bacterium]